jgi:hypothetical protein
MSEKPDWLKNLFPWEQKTLCVNGHSMTYVDEGKADPRPVVLLHGNPTWGFLYRNFVGPLVSADYRVIVPDWIGCGYSDHPRIDAGLTLARHIADPVSLIKSWPIKGACQVVQGEFLLIDTLPFSCRSSDRSQQGVGAALQRETNEDL